MSSTDVAPVTIQGQAIKPTQVSQPHSFSAHDFFNVIRDVVSSGAVYHTENDINDALNAVAAYESHVVPPSDANMVTTENDVAPKEDVSQRKPAVAPAVPAPSTGAPAIDYSKLAQALVAAGAFQQQASAPDDGSSDGSEVGK